MTEENRIIPTLAFAHHIDYGVSHVAAEKKRLEKVSEDGTAWEREADKFVSRYGSLRPVRVVDRILVLERLPASVEIDYHPDTNAPEEVTITAYAHRRPAKPEHVATLYEKTLSTAGVPYGESRTGYVHFDFYGTHLKLFLKRGNVATPLQRTTRGVALRFDKAAFPNPRLVYGFYQTLLGKPGEGGLVRSLGTRERGRSPDAANLIPACVAYCLRHFVGIEGRKEIHRLLNKHVPEEGYSTSDSNQLWRDVANDAKVGDPLMEAAQTLFYQDDE
jgi:hypothetical protein